MYLALPTSDQQRLQLLDDVLSGLTAPNAPYSYIDGALLRELNQLRDGFRQTYQDLHRIRATNRSSLALVAQRKSELRVLIRDAYQLVQRQRRNPHFPASLFEAFGLNRDGTQTSAIHRLRTPIQIAQQLIVAQQQAALKGFDLLISPTPAQLEAGATALIAAQQTHVESLNNERSLIGTIRQQRQKIKLLLRRVRMSVDLASLDRPVKERQALLQDLGFQYRNNAEERAVAQSESESLDAENASQLVGIAPNPVDHAGDDHSHDDIGHQQRDEKQNRGPHGHDDHAGGPDFGLARDALLLAELPHHVAEVAIVGQPIVETLGGTRKTSRCDQDERCGRHDRQQQTNKPQNQRDEAANDQQYAQKGRFDVTGTLG